MTAEVAVMNALGVALAADSAVTVSWGDGEHKIYTSAEKLFPLAAVITPNLMEASLLLGREIADVEDMKKAAALLKGMGPACVLIKGGHLGGAPEAVDIFYDGSEPLALASPRVETANTHGTGCMLSAALAAYLAMGEKPLQAASRAKRDVTRALMHSLDIGSGRGPVHPVPEPGLES